MEEGLWLERPYGVIHKKGDVVAGKYTIQGVFGQGAMGVTYEAQRDDGEVVALKAMSLRNMKGWKVRFDYTLAFLHEVHFGSRKWKWLVEREYPL